MNDKNIIDSFDAVHIDEMIMLNRVLGNMGSGDVSPTTTRFNKQRGKIFAVAFVAVIIVLGYSFMEHNQVDKMDPGISLFYAGVDKSDIVSSGSMEGDFLPVDFSSLMAKCDIIVTGTFIEKTGSEMLSAGVIITKTRFQIDQVLTGKNIKSGDKISVSFGGGIVPEDEYNSFYTGDALEKQGLTGKDGYIESTLGGMQAYPVSELKYLLFLKDGSHGPYLYGEKYSMLEINNGKVYNEISKEEKSIDAIREMIAK